MGKFNFAAKAINGQEMRGSIDAANEAEARVKLRARRLIPLKVVAAEKKQDVSKVIGGRGVKSKDLQILTRQLATLLGSGVPIVQAIEVLARSARGGLSFALKSIVSSINKGKRLGDALDDHPLVFDRFYVNMVRAGEESGNLDQILNRLAIYIEKSVKIQGKIKGAMVYPLGIMFIAALVISALLVFVIPKLQGLFSQSGGELPALTQIVINLSDFFVAYWWAIFSAMGAAIFFAVNYYRTPTGRQVFDQILIELPLMGGLIQKGAIARFTRTMSTLLGSGVGIMESLEISSRVVGNFVIERAIQNSKDAIAEGKSLTVPFAKEKYVPDMVTQMIGVGEATGNLDSMLSKIADFYEDEVDVAVTALTSVLEPILMAVLGVIIAVLVVAMYLPIFNLASAVGG